MTKYSVDTLYTLHDLKTKILFSLEYSDNRIIQIVPHTTNQLREIQIITESDSEQPMIPYPDICKSPDTFELQLAQIQAIESYYHCEIPEYARLVRLLLAEICRLLNHFNYFVSLGNSVQFLKLLEKSLRNKMIIEKIIQTVDITNSSSGYIIAGGLAGDLPIGFIEMLSHSIREIQQSLIFFEHQLYKNSLLSAQLENIGIIDHKTANTIKLTGPNYLASQDQSEYRIILHYSLPDDIKSDSIKTDFHKGSIGDSWHRCWIRFLEIEFSLQFITELINLIIKSEIKVRNVVHFSDREMEYSYRFYGAEGQILSRISKNPQHNYYTGKHLYPIFGIINNLTSLFHNERMSAVKILLSSLNFNPIKYLLFR